MRWKFYFWVLTPLMVAGTAFAIAESLGFLLPDEGDPAFSNPWNWLDWLDTFIIGVSLVGLFGIAYQKTIGNQSFWKRWFIFILIFDTAYAVYEYNTGVFDTVGMWRPEITFPLLIAFFIPYYVALYLYGYKSEELWNPPTNPNPL